MNINLKEKVKLFLGNCINASNGEWVNLPMEENQLKEKLTQLEKLYGELIISDYEKLDDFIQSLSIKQYSNIIDLNNILQKPNEFIALYINGDEDLEFAESMWKSGQYLYIPGVDDLNSLGEAIAKLGLIKGITQSTIESGYVNYEQIGLDFECNGITLYKGIGAIGQISEYDYLSWRHRAINAKSKSIKDFLLDNGIEPIDIDKHESDLYVKVTPLSEYLLSEIEHIKGYKISKQIFIDNISKERWFDIPFGYMPEHYKNR